MSDEQNPQDGVQQSAPGDDRWKNLQAEMDRKLGNIQQTLTQQVAQLAETLKPDTTPAPKADDNLDELWEYEPAKAAKLQEQKLNQKVDEKVNQIVESRLGAMSQEAQVIGQLKIDFPELNDGNHALTKRAIEIYGDYQQQLGQKPPSEYYQLAVQRAALEKGIQPSSVRPSSDHFQMVPGGKQPNARMPKNDDSSFEAQLEVAALLGRPVEDPAYQERLKGFARRDNFGRYAQPKEIKEKK